MALIVEDGSAKTDSESYISVSEADDYHTSYTASSAWSDAATGDKEIALRQATQWIDTQYDNRWKGQRVDEDQALAWPRYSVVDSDGYAYDSDEIPRRLRHATAELALRALSEDIYADITQANTGISEESKKVDVLQITTKYSGTKRSTPKYRHVLDLLRPLLRAGGAWLVRS